MEKNLFILVSGLCLFVFVGYANADTGRASWEIPIGNYTSDIGYTPGTFTQGQPEVFDFKLWKGAANSGVAADYQQIWIRILRWDDDDTLLATGLWNQPTGSTTLTYDFSEPGTYTLEASYRDADGNDIAVASSSITIDGGNTFSARELLFAGALFLVGLLIGGVGSFAWRTHHR